jgi:Xaa-Pro aminopeptidase
LRLLSRAVAVLCLLVAFQAVALEKQPASEFHARRAALAAKLNGGAALLFGADEPKEEYLSWRQSDDFYYLTGWNEPGAALLIEAAYTPASPTGTQLPGMPTYTAQPYREILFLPERNRRTELYTGVKLDADTPNAAAIAGVDEVRQIKDLPAELVRMTTGTTRATHIAAAGVDEKARAALAVFGASVGRDAPVTTELSALTMPLRSVKSPGEIALLKKAADASVAAHLAEMKAVHPGVAERSIDGLIDDKLKENGCERPSYPSIVGSGANSVMLHYMQNSGVMRDGDVEVTDAAGEYSMYASDVTRTLPVNGHFTPRQREIYEIVLGAQRAAEASFISGKTTMRDLDRVARQYIATHGKDLHGQSLDRYFLHSVGHSVGINVHDPFDSNAPWGPGAVFTIEPGIYIAEEKIGVRIEDTYYVDASGKLVDFIAALPHTADEVEAAMRPEPAKKRNK